MTQPIISVSMCFRFVKHLWRGYNTCSRCDFQFQPLPDSRLGQKRNECNPAKRVEPTPPTPPVVASSPVKEIKKEDRKEELKASHSVGFTYHPMSCLSCLLLVVMLDWIFIGQYHLVRESKTKVEGLPSYKTLCKVGD